MENHIVEKKTIDLHKANLFGLSLILPVVLIYGLPYYLIWGHKYSFSVFFEQLTLTHAVHRILTAFFVMMLGVVLHEFIHGAIWACFASKGWRSIKFGVLWTMLTPYCHCKEALKVRHYVFGAMGPAVLLGFVPGILANILGHPGMLLFAFFFTIAAAGDFMTVWLIRKESPDTLVQDHPSEAGYFVYRKTEE